MGSAEARVAELTRTCAEQRGTIEALTVAAEKREVRWRDELRHATRESSQLALVARHMDSAVVIANADGLLEWVNEAFTRMSGYTEAEALGKTGRSLLSTDQTLPPIEELTQGDGRLVLPEILTRTRDGRRYWLKIDVFRVLDDDGVLRLVNVMRDVTALHEAQDTLLDAMGHSEELARELSAEKALLAGVISAIPHLTYWKDADGYYNGHNAAFLAMREVPSGTTLLGRTEGDLGRGDEFAAVLLGLEEQVLRTGLAVVDQRVTFARADGSPRVLLMSVLPHPDPAGQIGGLIGVGADVTRASEMERQLNQTNRLEAIGRLAAGIAHEINTPIQFISDNTSFVAQSLTPMLGLVEHAARSCAPGAATDPDRLAAELTALLAGIDVEFLVAELPAALAESLEGLERVAHIVRAMKDFSHPGQGRSPLDLNRAIESTVQVARNEWKYCAELELRLAPDVGLVPCFGGEVKQVVLNLLVNAAHAIEARPRLDGGLGLIRITTTRFDDRVEIAVEDDGAGMDEATRQRIFDPFFTTKEVGKGTGQGLSLTFASIVQKHGGSVLVDSTPGVGTTFTIVLPTGPKVPDTPPLVPAAAAAVDLG